MIRGDRRVIYFIADTHFYHQKVIEFSNRRYPARSFSYNNDFFEFLRERDFEDE